MSDQSGNGGEAPQTAPRFTVLAQYTKDLSFENPNAPRSLGPQQTSPNLSVQINVNARQLTPTDYEVSLMLEGGAGQGADTLFKFELNYAGVFRIENFPADQVQPIVMIEGPRLLFPFARQIIADAVRGGSFPRCSSTRSTSTRSICSAWRRRRPAAGATGLTFRSPRARRRRSGRQSAASPKVAMWLACACASSGRRRTDRGGREMSRRGAWSTVSPLISTRSSNASDRCRPPVNSL